MINIYKGDQIGAFLERFESRRQEISQDVRDSVTRILRKVREHGDAALSKLTRKFDGADIPSHNLQVSNEDIEKAVHNMPPGWMDILRESVSNIRRFHEKEKRQSWLDWKNPDTLLGQRITPLERVGIYVPGGRAVYPSSLIMAAVPAQAAGVHEILAVSPPDKNGQIHMAILAAAQVLGISRIFKVGGAQAIGALAYGTKIIPRVDKIVGPGNIYVAEGKRQVYGLVDIDMIAGPSEVVILADSTANPDFTAADLLAQAEHDPLASAICVTDNENLANQVKQAILEQAQTLQRAEIFEPSLKTWGGILVTKNWEQAISLTNRLAAEHLGLHVNQPWETIGRIRNAGAIFLGHFSPETAGDYWAGPNHVLPTNQTARFASPLGTGDFQKVSSIIQYSQSSLKMEAEKIMTFANMEGFDGHANAVKQRIK
ncbi:histidinol dehydrogenase [bacterium]|nr:histidinol dehydrogenase [bacterium]